MSKIMKDKDKKDKPEKPPPKKKLTLAEEEEERKRQIDEQIEKERGRFLEQMEDLVKELEKMRSENEKLKKQQETRFGGTVDTVDKLKQELDRVKSTNKFLLNDIETRKNQCEQLQTQVFEMNLKAEANGKKMGELLKENHRLKVERESLVQDQNKNFRLLEENRKLRQWLSTNRIDTKTGKPLIEMLKKRSISDKKTPPRPVPLKQNKRAVEENQMRYQEYHSKSLEDLRKLSEFYGNKNTRSKEEPPSYLGNYMDIMRQKKVKNNNHQKMLMSFR